MEMKRKCIQGASRLKHARGLHEGLGKGMLSEHDKNTEDEGNRFYEVA